MKPSRSILLQAAVWISIWLIFMFAGDAKDKLPGFYVVTTLRVAVFAVFFNLVYYALMPVFFSGRKRAFYVWSGLALAGYLAFSLTVDLTIGKPEKMFTQARAQKKLNWFFLLVPPIITSSALFGAAATFRGLAAFEQKEKEEEEANRRRLEAEIALLKSQINPHFLLNTLNNLYALALTQPEKTPEALLKLSEMVSYILYECAKPKVELAQDMAFIENYITLQQLRLPPNATLTVEWPAQVPERMLIEPMILISFIENAFKHGLTTRQPCEILIAIHLSGQQLTLRVENPLLPPKQAQNGGPSGVGMANTQQRLAHSYPGRHRLQLDNDGQRHWAELEIKLES